MADIADRFTDSFYFSAHNRSEGFEIFPGIDWNRQSLEGILVPGGGLEEDGKPKPSFVARLDNALDYDGNRRTIIVLSKGTAHKPPVNADGHPVYEAEAGRQWLLARGVPEERIITETQSLDTIGNAFYGRELTYPSDLRELLVITSAFHIARTSLVFDWVFNLKPPPLNRPYALHFLPTPNAGFKQEQLDAIREWELKRIEDSRILIAEISTFEQLRQYMSSECYLHGYDTSRPPALVMIRF